MTVLNMRDVDDQRWGMTRAPSAPEHQQLISSVEHSSRPYASSATRCSAQASHHFSTRKPKPDTVLRVRIRPSLKLGEDYANSVCNSPEGRPVSIAVQHLENGAQCILRYGGFSHRNGRDQTQWIDSRGLDTHERTAHAAQMQKVTEAQSGRSATLATVPEATEMSHPYTSPKRSDTHGVSDSLAIKPAL